MRPRVVLDDVAGQLWLGSYDLMSHKTSAKLASLLDIVGMGELQVSAVSCHGAYIATATHDKTADLLYIISLLENSYYLLKRMSERCTALQFHAHQENQLFLASAASTVYSVNVEDGTVVMMTGHRQPVVGVEAGLRSPMVLTYNHQEVLWWSWPSMVLTNRLRQQDLPSIIWAGHVWQRDELLVAYSSGSVLLWAGRRSTTEEHIEPPEGLTVEFTAFAVSRGGEWLVGGGKSHLLVTYCLASRCVAQVVQLPASCTDVFHPFFLPVVNPRYPQVLAILTSSGVLNTIDFNTTTKLKTLRAQRYLIGSVSVSECGSFIAVTYNNSTTKVYPVRALFPATTEREVDPEAWNKEEVAFQIVEKREKDKQVENENRKKRNAVTEEIRELLDKSKWCKILLEYGSYPDRYRCLVWVSVLELPRNYSVFSTLLDKGIHPAYQDLSEALQLSDTGLFKALQRTLSCLAHWAPFLAKVDYLPEFLFPFIKVFRTNPLLSFEVAATVIVNWCRVWFVFWPEAGVTVLNVVEQLVCEADPTLLAHLMRLRVTAHSYVWPLLTSAFSKVFSSSDWQALWDHLLSSPPSLLPCMAAAFTLTSRRSLLSCDDAEDVDLYYSQESWVSVKKVLDRAYDLHKRKRKEHSFLEIFGDFTPLPHDGLPLFVIGPRPATLTQKEDEGKPHIRESPNASTPTMVTPRHLSPRQPASLPIRSHQYHKHQQHQREEQEEMVYVIGKDELERQEDECLKSIWRLRQRHLASAPHSLT